MPQVDCNVSRGRIEGCLVEGEIEFVADLLREGSELSLFRG
jgi:hypothetical protein